MVESAQKSTRSRTCTARSRRQSIGSIINVRTKATGNVLRFAAITIRQPLLQIRGEKMPIVKELDGLCRDPHGVEATIKALAGPRIEVIVPKLGKLDLTSVAGKIMLKILATVAQMERDLLVDRNRSGLASTTAEG